MVLQSASPMCTPVCNRVVEQLTGNESLWPLDPEDKEEIDKNVKELRELEEYLAKLSLKENDDNFKRKMAIHDFSAFLMDDIENMVKAHCHPDLRDILKVLCEQNTPFPPRPSNYENIERLF